MTKVNIDRALIERAVDAAFSPYCAQDLAILAPALRAALAEPAVEPVAWVLSHSQGIEFSSKYPLQKSRDAAEQMARQHMGVMTVTPLYTTPQPPTKPAVEPVVQFIASELDLLRQWFESMQDTNGGYIIDDDLALYKKIKAALKASPPQAEPARTSQDVCTVPLLTDEDIERIDRSMCGEREFADVFARAVEAMVRSMLGLK